MAAAATTAKPSRVSAGARESATTRDSDVAGRSDVADIEDDDIEVEPVSQELINAARLAS